MDESRKVVLTPECQSLWIVSPSILLLYDKVVLDDWDAAWMLNPGSDTKLAIRRAQILMSLQEWGLVETKKYSKLLEPNSRHWVNTEAKKIVANSLPKEGQPFFESTFVKRGLHAHREFANYLENTILFCSPGDEPSIKRNVDRLLQVNRRIKCLQDRCASDEILEQILWTLERVVAKALAGLLVAGKICPNALYDTAEYRPFIEDILSTHPALPGSFRSDIASKPFGIVLGALLDKKIPDITLWDESEYFRLLRSRSEFLRLRSTLGMMERLYGELLNEREEFVRQKITADIKRMQNEFEVNLKKALENVFRKWTWRLWEMVAGGTPAGTINPIVDKLKERSDAEYESSIGKSLLGGAGLDSGLFFVSDVWKRRLKNPDLPDKTTKHASYSKEYPVWGLGERNLPWYENPRDKR